MSTAVAPPRNAVTVDALNSARRRAQRLRAEWLTSVHEGFMPVTDLIAYAATEDGAPLRRVRLRELLLSQERWGESRTETVLASLRAVLNLGDDLPLRRITVGWLLDNRTSGQRFDAFLDVLGAATGAGRSTPWTGFPFTTVTEARP